MYCRKTEQPAMVSAWIISPLFPAWLGLAHSAAPSPSVVVVLTSCCEVRSESTERPGKVAVPLAQQIWFPESSLWRMEVFVWPKAIFPQLQAKPQGDCGSPKLDSVSAHGFPDRTASPVPITGMIYSRE